MMPAVATLDASAVREDQLKLGLWMFLGTVTMLFAAFTSAYIVRRSGNDWRHVALPSLLWFNSGVLVASSIAVEFAQLYGARERWTSAAASMLIAVVLGIGFLAGQVAACRQMLAAGVYLPTSPHSAFFYLITGAHAVHVVAALAVLGWGAAVTIAGARDLRLWTSRMALCRTFWHYLGMVWIFLLMLVTYV